MTTPPSPIPDAELTEHIRKLLAQANDGSQGMHTQIFLFTSAFELSKPYEILRKSTTESIELFIAQVAGGTTQLPGPARTLFVTSLRKIISG